MKAGEQDDLLSRLASKAKKKLNKVSDSVSEDGEITKKGIYEFVKSDRLSDRQKLVKKIETLLKSNPDCQDPIGKLIDRNIYTKLTEEKKQAYVMRLSADYSEIVENLRQNKTSH